MTETNGSKTGSESGGPQPDASGLFMQKERKPVNRSFLAEWPATCNYCHVTIQVGERARYNPDGLIVHHRHLRQEQAVEVCDRCWLTKPCECDD